MLSHDDSVLQLSAPHPTEGASSGYIALVVYFPLTPDFPEGEGSNFLATPRLSIVRLAHVPGGSPSITTLHATFTSSELAFLPSTIIVRTAVSSDHCELVAPSVLLALDTQPTIPLELSVVRAAPLARVYLLLTSFNRTLWSHGG